jgi:hypothetical protein
METAREAMGQGMKRGRQGERVWDNDEQHNGDNGNDAHLDVDDIVRL